MKLYKYLTATLLILTSRVDAKCVLEHNVKYSFQHELEYDSDIPSKWTNLYTCKGGSVIDLQDIPEDDYITIIVIEDMPLGSLNNSMFKRFAGHLVALTCTNCQLTNIDDDTFVGLKNLRYLSLPRNNLTKVKTAWFNDTVYLKTLEFTGNRINDIENNAFSKLDILTSIDLRHNNLTRLKAEWFAHLVGVNIVSLQANKISSIEDNTFSNLTRLQYLALEGNKLKQAKGKWFGDNATLQMLSLSNNNVEYFAKELLKELHSLEALSIFNSKLDCASIKKIIEGLPKLNLLSIENSTYFGCGTDLIDVVSKNDILIDTDDAFNWAAFM